MRAAIFAATVLLVGCPNTKPEGPRAAADRALRIRVARAEAKREGGVAELVDLAKTGDAHAKQLALRGLARSGAVHELETLGAGEELLELAAWLDDSTRLSDQKSLAACAGTRAACGIALGKLGRRKIALAAEARAALAAAADSNDVSVRYAAVYALYREHEPPADEGVQTALVARLTDAPEIRASAIAALVKRKALGAARPQIEAALDDADWRVAVEAARALANADDAGRLAVATALRRQWATVTDPRRAHIVIEALRTLIGKPIADPRITAMIAQLGANAAGDMAHPTLTRGWVECLALAVTAPPSVVDALPACSLPDHLRLPLLAEIVTAHVGDAMMHRAALRILLAHEDARVRAAGIGALAATWQESDAKARATIVGTVVSALGSTNSIVAGSAIDAASGIYDALGAGDALQVALDAAVVARAASEHDVELLASLYELIGKRAIAAGADACKAGLGGPPVRAKAAAECLRALGQGVSPPPVVAAPAPPVDLDAVVGRLLRWHLATSRGEIVVELRPDVAPWAVATIVTLTRRHFYDGLEFHRVVPNFVVQGGDPTMSGLGGPGFTTPAEPWDGAGFVQGGVGIADAGRDSGGSQWFIMHSRAPHLDGRYTWIGRVIRGQQIADALLVGDRVERATIEQL